MINPRFKDELSGIYCDAVLTKFTVDDYNFRVKSRIKYAAKNGYAEVSIARPDGLSHASDIRKWLSGIKVLAERDGLSARFNHAERYPIISGWDNI